MTRFGRRAALAVVWLVLVAAAAIHVGLTVHRGLPLQTDFMALLPREDRDPTVQQAKDAMLEAISQRIVILVGHSDPAAARAAADSVEQALAGAGLITANRDIPDAEAMRRMGALYFAHRAGLLADGDRRLLLEGRGADLLTRALSQIYGFVGIADSRLLTQDPFQLFPAFLASLPVPANRLSFDDGRMVTRDGATTWALVTGQLTGKATALAFERRFVDVFTTAAAAARQRAPDLQILRLGAVFFAHEGAQQGMAETSLIGGLSLAGAVLLFLLVFRRMQPLLLGVTAIAVGLTVALSVSLALFGELHVAAQLFGAEPDRHRRRLQSGLFRPDLLADGAAGRAHSSRPAGHRARHVHRGGGLPDPSGLASAGITPGRGVFGGRIVRGILHGGLVVSRARPHPAAPHGSGARPLGRCLVGLVA